MGMTTSRLVAARKRQVVRTASVVGLLIAIACVSVAMPIKHYPYPSPIDEMVHFDYILAIPDVPVTGDRIAPTVMREWACRTSGPEFVLSIPACNDRPYQTRNFPGEGWSTAGGHPPLYYAVTALATRPVAKLTGLSLFSLGRAFGAFWLAAFMFVCFAIARRLGVGDVPALAAAVLRRNLTRGGGARGHDGSRHGDGRHERAGAARSARLRWVPTHHAAVPGSGAPGIAHQVHSL